MKKNAEYSVRRSDFIIKLLAIMRISTLLIMFSFLSICVEGHSQNEKLSIHSENITIRQLFSLIEKESHYKFLYNDDYANFDKTISLHATEKPLNAILDEVFCKADIGFKLLENNLIVIAPKSVLQQKRITGIVTDASTGESLVGVNVRIEGTNIGTATDKNGKYSLTVPQNKGTLIFSFIGYSSTKIQLDAQTSYNIKLVPNLTKLDEVVVVGYGTQKKANLTGAVAAASGKVLENRPIANLGQGLQGVIPSLQVTQSNYSPGQGATFNVRGITSLNGGDPLILVDGVVQDPNLLNPEDIESVSVLKDAASAAIYGARAAFGVILITSKKGKSDQRPTLSVTSSYTNTSATNIPKYADSWEYITNMNIASVNAGGSNYFDQRLMDNALKYYKDPTHNLPVYYDAAIDKDGKYNYCGNTDWAKELYKNGGVRQINANLSGGTEKTKYYISYGYMKQEGFLKGFDDQYKRHNVNVSVNSDVLKWLTLSTRTKYTYSYEDHPSKGSGWNGVGALSGDLRPLMPVKHPDGNYSGQGTFTNPIALYAQGGYDRRKVNDLLLTGAIDIHPIKDLHINADYTFNPYSKNRDLSSRLFSEYWAAPGKSNLYPWTNPNGVYLENTNNYYTAINTYIDYTKSLKNHNFKILAGYNQEETKTKMFYAEHDNLIDNDLPAINRATGEKYIGGNSSSWATQGVFFRFNYDYAKKYLLELNGRYDGSSKFPKDDRFAFFPSISGGWRISEEPFWKKLKPIIGEAKIRGSYGSLGNQNVSGDFPYISNYGITSAISYILGDVRPVGISSGSLISPSFTWEKVNQWNFGTDFGFIKNKLTATFDVYQRKTIGMLTTGQPLPAVLGTGVPRENAADLKTYGWESSITWNDKIEELVYSISFNISDYQSEITKFNNPTGDLGSRYIGQKIGEIWGYEATGLFQSLDEIAKHADQSKLYGGKWNPGDVKYVDLDNNNIISPGKNTLTDHGDKKIIGNDTPRYQYGLQMNASWKGFDLDIFFQGVGKRDLWLGDDRFFGIAGQWNVPMKATLDYWTENNTDARLPRPYINGGHGNREVSSLYLQNAAYLRLKQLSLGYTIPGKWTKKAAISRARIYFTGQNILTWTKLNELYDPENTAVNGYPVPKSFSVGVNLTF